MGGATSFRRSARCFMKVFAMESSVRDHYQSVNLIEKIDAGLTAAKKTQNELISATWPPWISFIPAASGERKLF